MSRHLNCSEYRTCTKFTHAVVGFRFLPLLIAHVIVSIPFNVAENLAQRTNVHVAESEYKWGVASFGLSIVESAMKHLSLYPEIALILA